MLLEETIQRVQSLYSSGVQSKDTRLTPRHIYSALCTGRSIVLRQQFNKKQAGNQWAYQTLPCVEMIKAPTNECPCVPTNGCVILRSKHKIPKPISGLDKHLIQSVTSIDGSVKFDVNTFENVRYSVAGNKYTGNKAEYYFRNQYLYITIKKELKAIQITGLFDDPIAAYTFPSICGDCDECLDIMTLEFPIDGDLVKPIIQIASDELITIMKQIPEDAQDNAQDDTKPGGMIHQPNQGQ